MTKGLLFWIVFIVSVLLYFGLIFWPEHAQHWHGNAVHAVEFLLIGLLGWKVFGKPITD